MVKNNILLDTHVFIWAMEKNNRLSSDIQDMLTSPTTSIFISVASVWEIVIKKAKKKLKISQDIEAGIKKAKFTILPLEIAHVLAVENLPLHHQDPFDRVLLAQAKIESLSLITADKKMWRYKTIDIIKV